MKNIILLVSFFLTINSISQENGTKRFAISLETNYGQPFGNNFLNKGYKPNIGFGFESQINFKKLFLGLGVKYNNLTITNKNIVGDFSSSNLTINYWFIGYRHYLKGQKTYFEERIGFSSNIIDNSSAISNYINSGNSWFLGSKFNYKLNQALVVFIGVDLT